MLFRKKKKQLFGGNITPSCDYCQYNLGEEGTFLCSKNLTMENGKCKRYRYDPLMRRPKSFPALPAGRYSADEFKL